MKQVILICLFSCFYTISGAQVMPKDSTDTSNNSAASRKKGLHTNGASETDKRKTWSDTGTMQKPPKQKGGGKIKN